MNRKAILAGTAVGVAAAIVPAKKAYSTYKSFREEQEEQQSGFSIEEATISDIHQAFDRGDLTSAQLTAHYIKRIETLDQKGPNINSIRIINPDAMNIARKRDQERKKGVTGPLHGIPVLLKDNIETRVNMPTTAGSLALENNFTEEDAFLVKKLREAGAVILGKTNMSEWAYFMSDKAPSGYSSIAGQVLHPYGPEDFKAGSVGGSSSGSGAAIAANFGVVSIGTETSGSILSPASANSIVGIKPTVGLISRGGIIPLAKSQDTAGPMARTVTDVAIALGTMTGIDEKDPVTQLSQGCAMFDYTKNLNKDGLKGAVIGVDKSFFSKKSSQERKVMEEAIKDMEAAGAVIKEVKVPNEDFESKVLWYEMKLSMDEYLRNTSDKVPVSSLQELIAYNKSNAKVMLPFGQKLLEQSDKMSGDPEDPTYLEHRAKDVRNAGTQGIDAVMKEHMLDALLFENNLGAAIPAKAGYPSITVPAGYTKKGMPVGVTFSAKAFSEPKLIELAYAYEQATKKRKAPVL
ncbi:amidase family protein [Alkalicoccus daliensis]|uniref:Amidase n=1 Tax=Alkalicoccus daliensis TaxID=745820 RepID=A0A1H0EX25_9BACI|nr:amidase family protein [Alkalicoccus daliensis]SDN86895.1 amidase [Alkalicoccus daliensis]